MFGYIKPAYAELRVREHEMYKALYCGLCRSMGKYTGQLSRFTLAYDYVFLAMINASLSGERFSLKNRRCPAHPLTKKPMAQPCDQLEYCAYVSAIFSAAKTADTVADERGAKKLGARLVSPAINSMKKRAALHTGELSDTVRSFLSELSELERGRCASVDEAAKPFADALAAVMEYPQKDERSRKIARAVGSATGKFIYIADAADDAADDIKSGSYNPIVCAWGEDITEVREIAGRAGRRVMKKVLRSDIAESLNTAMSYELSRLSAAVELIDFEKNRELRGIINNIIYIGMPGELRRVLGLLENERQSDERSL